MADGRCSQAALDFLSTMDVGTWKAGPATRNGGGLALLCCILGAWCILLEGLGGGRKELATWAGCGYG